MLPRTCNPDSLAARGERLRGALPLGSLHRFRQAVDSARGPVRVSLDFARDETGLASVSGRLEVPVRLTCQRCLEPLDLLLEATLDVLAGRPDGEDAEREQGRDVLQTHGDLLLLHEMIEDELILALPMHASHPPGYCSPPARPASRVSVPSAPPRSPFAALADLIDPTTASEAAPHTDEDCVEANGALAKPQAGMPLAASNLQSTKPGCKSLARL